MRSRTVRRRTRRSRLKKFLVFSLLFILLVLAVGIGILGGTIISVSKMLPTGIDIGRYRPTEATKIMSSDGVVLGEIYEENREFVPIKSIPKDLQNATVAIEDERFYKHPGVDFIGIFRAVYQNLRRGHMSQGGSTLTQQLARNIYLTREKKLSRKLQEVALAIQLERHFTKQKILELYLNQVYYGSGAYGVETASRTYFGRSAKQLTLAQSALLAGLPQKPSGYSPYEDVRAAVRRRDTVLTYMCRQGYITQDQCDQAKKERVHLAGLKRTGIAKYKAPWFVTYVVKELTDKYGSDLYRGGLRIYTTLNYEMQQTAEEALRKAVHGARRKNVHQGALICIDPTNGYIKAMVGSAGEDFLKDQFNRAVSAKRQPGSSFKAFVYTAAVDEGYGEYDTMSNRRITFPGHGGEPWSPKNFDSRYSSGYTMKEAIARSVNVVAVRWADRIGVDNVIKYARLLGIKSDLGRTLSIALGAYVVSPLELCSAYGVFAADGVRAEPMSIVRITDAEGSPIEENKPVTKQVLSEQTAETMADMFRAVVTHGTGRSVSYVPNAHGKTGTTSDDRDAWFVGFTPELVTAVWVGNDDYTPMRGVWGGNVCAPAWGQFMLKALQVHRTEAEKEKQQAKLDATVTETSDPTSEKDANAQTEPSIDDAAKTVNVRICMDSGLVANSGCPRTYDVSYAVGSQPTQVCTTHRPSSRNADSADSQPTPTTDYSPPPVPRSATQPRSNRSREYVTVRICSESGQIANAYCPETIERTYPAGDAPRKVCRTHRAPSE